MKRKLLIVSIFGLIVLAWTLACLGVSGKTTAARAAVTPPPKLFPQPAFIVGVWYQPSSSFAKWKSRGINTLWGYEGEGGTVSIDTWCKAAVAGGFNYVLQNKPGTSSHYNDLNCVAVALDPDEANAQGGPPGQPTPPAALQQERAAIRNVTLKPILINFDGWKLQWQDDPTVKSYCDCADWLALDYYVVNRGEGISNWPRVQTQIDRLKRLAPGKPVLVFIECGDQDLKVQDWLHDPANQPQGEQQAALMRGPTTQEMAFELDASYASGCGVVYFPDRIGKNWEAYDDVPDDNAAAMTAWNVGHASATSPQSPAPSTAPSPAKAVLRTITVTIYADGSSDVASK